MLKRAPSYRTLELELLEWQERELLSTYVVVSLKEEALGTPTSRGLLPVSQGATPPSFLASAFPPGPSCSCHSDPPHCPSPECGSLEARRGRRSGGFGPAVFGRMARREQPLVWLKLDPRCVQDFKGPEEGP